MPAALRQLRPPVRRECHEPGERTPAAAGAGAGAAGAAAGERADAGWRKAGQQATQPVPRAPGDASRKRRVPPGVRMAPRVGPDDGITMLSPYEMYEGVIKPIRLLDERMEECGGLLPVWSDVARFSSGESDAVPARMQWAVRTVDPRCDRAAAAASDPSADDFEKQRDAEEEEGDDPVSGRRHSPSGLDRIGQVSVEDIPTGDAYSHCLMLKRLQAKFDPLLAVKSVPCIVDCGIFDDIFIGCLENAPNIVPICGQFHYGRAVQVDSIKTRVESAPGFSA